jgi:hypothetical protein
MAASTKPGQVNKKSLPALESPQRIPAPSGLDRQAALQYPAETSLLAMVVIGTLAGCSSKSTRSADVSGGIRTSLDQAGLKAVPVTEDHDKGVVTLGGTVTADVYKSQAESIATSMAGAVIPPGQRDAKKMNSDPDKGIEGNLDAALLQSGLHKNVNYAVNNQVVTMTGEWTLNPSVGKSKTSRPPSPTYCRS